MISNYDATQKYKITTEITSTRKTKQVVMLYDGVIKFLSETLNAIKENNCELRFNSTEKASKIIDGLNSCLDPDKGQEITVILDRFYSAIFMRIMDINFEKDKEVNLKNCTQLISEIKIMRDAWNEIDERMVRGEIDVGQNIETSKDFSEIITKDGFSVDG